MKTLQRLATRLYPRPWRDRYGEELAALIEDAQPGWIGTLDLVKGAIMMQARSLLQTLKPMTWAAFAGFIVAVIIGMMTLPRYAAEATFRVRLDDLRSQPLVGRLGLLRMKEALRERPELPALIQERRMYACLNTPRERLNALLADTSLQLALRGDPDAPLTITYAISYANPNPITAEAVMDAFTPLVLDITRERASSAGSTPVAILSRAKLLPDFFVPNLPRMALIGLAYGASSGLLLVFLIAAFRRFFRRRTQVNPTPA